MSPTIEYAPSSALQNTFEEFPKMARLTRECTITEKIDGTNAQVFVWDEFYDPSAKAVVDELDLLSGPPRTMIGPPPANVPWIYSCDGLHVAAGSRNRWIRLGDDNFGFASWVAAHAPELAMLGHGRHFGEWWGSGIQRGYGLPKGEKRFSLFNTVRWCPYGKDPQPIPCGDPRKPVRYQDVLPGCCSLVPVLYRGMFTTVEVDNALGRLMTDGSLAAPGFAKPEGVVVFHTAANTAFKKTIEKDESPKSAPTKPPHENEKQED